MKTLFSFSFNPLNPSLLLMDKHLAITAIGSCPLLCVPRRPLRHHATFFSFPLCVRPRVERQRDLLCTFLLTKKRQKVWDEWMKEKIWGLADSLAGSVSRWQTSLALRSPEPLYCLTQTKNALPFSLMRSFYRPETKIKITISLQ